MKVNRHAKIVELINKYQIETQDELAEYLNEAGFKVTQATVRFRQKTAGRNMRYSRVHRTE